MAVLLWCQSDYLMKNEVYNLVINKEIVAYYSFFNIDDEKVKLDNLFILPEFIGNKYGAYLMEDFMLRVKEKGMKLVTLDSDPNSVNFYIKLASHHSQGYTCIPTSSFNQDGFSINITTLQRRLNHIIGRSVFNTTSRVKPFKL